MNRNGSLSGQAALNAAKTHCKQGHPLSGDNLLMRKYPRGEFRSCRLCYTTPSARKSKGRVSEDQLRAIFEGLRSGATLNSMIVYRPGSRPIVRKVELINFRQMHPKIDRQIQKLAIPARKQAWINNIRRNLIVRPLAADPLELMRLIAKHVPAHLPADMRDDVTQNVAIAVLERRLHPKDIPARIRQFVSSEFKTAHNKWGERSLDMPLSIDNSTLLIETITQGFWQ